MKLFNRILFICLICLLGGCGEKENVIGDNIDPELEAYLANVPAEDIDCASLMSSVKAVYKDELEPSIKEYLIEQINKCDPAFLPEFLAEQKKFSK